MAHDDDKLWATPVSGAPWWLLLTTAIVGGAAAIGGAVWASRVQRRSAARAEWFRRLQWAWELTQTGDVPSVTAGMTMMDYLADAADLRDAAIIEGIAPIVREIGRLAADYPDESGGLDIVPDTDDTGRERAGEEGEADGRPRGSE